MEYIFSKLEFLISTSLVLVVLIITFKKNFISGIDVFQESIKNSQESIKKLRAKSIDKVMFNDHILLQEHKKLSKKLNEINQESINLEIYFGMFNAHKIINNFFLSMLIVIFYCIGIVVKFFYSTGFLWSIYLIMLIGAILTLMSMSIYFIIKVGWKCWKIRNLLKNLCNELQKDQIEEEIDIVENIQYHISLLRGKT